jgi:Aldehyde dehydrogenase family
VPPHAFSNDWAQGKSAGIVLDDADIDLVVRTLRSATIANSGQQCNGLTEAATIVGGTGRRGYRADVGAFGGQPPSLGTQEHPAKREGIS